MKRLLHICIYAVLTCTTLAAFACGGESDTAPDESAPEPTAPLAQSVPTAAPPTATPVPEPTRPPVTAEVGTNVGNRAPDFTLNLPQGRQVSSTDLVAQGKPVFILFHATW